MWLNHLSILFWFSSGFFALTADEAELKLFQQKCNTGANISCVRMGLRWLQPDYNLSDDKKRLVYKGLTRAYIAMRQTKSAKTILARLVRLDPCNKTVKGFRFEEQSLYRQTRQAVIKDAEPPVISHTVPSISEFRRDRTIRVRVTNSLLIHRVELHFRTSPQGEYQSLSMTKGEARRYAAQFPKEVLRQTKTIEYFTKAQDCGERTAYNGQPNKPNQLSLEGIGNTNNLILPSLLIGAGAVLIIGGGTAFYGAGTIFEQWRATDDIPRSEELRQQIILYHVIGLGGIILGAISAGVGAYMLLPKNAKERTNKVLKSISQQPHPAPSAQPIVHVDL